jgi:hypothetical protein
MFVRPAQLVRSPAQLVHVLGQWHLHSQDVARRNALVASVALEERRRELEEVERFLAARDRAAASRVQAPGQVVQPL